MESEYRVLNHLQENELTTQRNISKRTGLSLGAVNLLLKKMIRKGLVKVEKLNARNIRYILTPKGLSEKSRLAYRYINDSFQQILKINSILDYLIEECSAAGADEPLLICGPPDDIRKIFIQYLEQKKIKFELHDIDSLLRSSLNQNQVLTWRTEEEDALKSHLKVVNVMSML